MKRSNILKIGLVKAGISQVEASEQFGVAISTIHRQCNSENPTLSTIIRYAQLCGLEASELIALSE